MLTPVILGMDKMTVSVATGHQEFHPVYMSLGNVHNEMRRAHGSGLVSGQHARLRTQLGQRSFEQIRLLYITPCSIR